MTSSMVQEKIGTPWLKGPAKHGAGEEHSDGWWRASGGGKEANHGGGPAVPQQLYAKEEIGHDEKGEQRH